ncbi:MAG: ribonuclease PH [Deltaproteobacteria bacterium]|nr:ribonuclease PH [Deltaproteobacteria bacterium]
MSKRDGRGPKDPRELIITPDYTMHAEGSVLVQTGETKVICTASFEESVPPFLRGKGTGWVTAEYNMLPRSTNTRIRRERSSVGGRTLEIQRLIGRSLRSVVDLQALGERSLVVDCDVIQADGGTRTASITGGFVALALALKKIQREFQFFKSFPVKNQVAGISLGIVEGEILLDLDYSEDSRAEVDLNLVMTDEMKLIEVQGTAERNPFTKRQLLEMIDLAESGLKLHFEKQLQTLSGSLNVISEV